MLKRLAIMLMIFSTTFAYAQTVEELSDGYIKEGGTIITQNADSAATVAVEPKLSFGLTAGTSVGFSSAYGATMSTFLAPHISYKFTPKFTMNAGLRLQVNSLNNSFSRQFGEGNNVTFYRPATQTFLYTQGVYTLNEKVKLSGTLFTGINTFDAPGLRSSSYNLNTYGGILGVEYKVGRHSTISAELQISRGPGYRQTNPLFAPGNNFHETLPIW